LPAWEITGETATARTDRHRLHHVSAPSIDHIDAAPPGRAIYLKDEDTSVLPVDAHRNRGSSHFNALNHASATAVEHVDDPKAV